MKHVFLTGATGTIGSALTPLFLNEPDTRVAVLIRAKNEAELGKRVAALLHYWNMSPADTRAARLLALRGDAAEPKFGLSNQQYDRLFQETTHIIHGAASVKLTLPLEKARANAVIPVRSILELADACRRHGALRKVEVISTVGVGGRLPGVIPERPLPEVREFHNTYEAAKAEAEQCVFGAWKDLPITVHRPSMVVGDSRTGRIIHFQVFYYLCEFFSGRHTFGVLPRVDRALDVIPVDYVAGAIHWSSGRSDSAGRIFHLCSGPDGAIQFSALSRMVRDALGGSGVDLPRARYVSLPLFRRLLTIAAVLASEKQRGALSTLPVFLDYLGEWQAFANTETHKILDSAGIPVPAVESYLPKILAYYCQDKMQLHAASGSLAIKPLPNS